MQKERKTKIITIVALMVCVVGLSIAFAAFSSTMTFKSSATVNPSKEDFNLDFTNPDGGTDPVPPTPTGDGASGTEAEIGTDESGNPVISNLSATFKEPGQKVVYTFKSANSSPYVIYLKSITFENASGSSTHRVCTAGTGTTDSLVQSACSSIRVSIKVGSDSVVTSTKNNITGHSLAKGASENIIVTIEYVADAPVADGDFTVKFGDIKVVYSTAD